MKCQPGRLAKRRAMCRPRACPVSASVAPADAEAPTSLRSASVTCAMPRLLLSPQNKSAIARLDARRFCFGRTLPRPTGVRADRGRAHFCRRAQAGRGTRASSGRLASVRSAGKGASRGIDLQRKATQCRARHVSIYGPQNGGHGAHIARLCPPYGSFDRTRFRARRSARLTIAIRARTPDSFDQQRRRVSSNLTLLRRHRNRWRR